MKTVINIAIHGKYNIPFLFTKGSASQTASTIGNIMAVVAVFEIHMDRKVSAHSYIHK